jgi:hypothetical protein
MLWFFGIAWVGGAIATYRELRSAQVKSIGVKGWAIDLMLALTWPIRLVITLAAGD